MVCDIPRQAYNRCMIVRNPNNVYLALAMLAGLFFAFVYFFGWRSVIRRDRDLGEIYPPRAKTATERLSGRMSLAKRADVRIDLFLGRSGLIAAIGLGFAQPAIFAAVFPREDRQVGAIEAVVAAGEVGCLAAGAGADDFALGGHNRPL